MKNKIRKNLSKNKGIKMNIEILHRWGLMNIMLSEVSMRSYCLNLTKILAQAKYPLVIIQTWLLMIKSKTLMKKRIN